MRGPHRRRSAPARVHLLPSGPRRDQPGGLTLRLLCGLTTAEVARAFLVSESTMAARITRAKHKIAGAGIAYRVPPPEELPARVDAVLTVIHLVFTTGHTAPVGADLVRRDLVERALDLARMLATLLPDDPGVLGCWRSSSSPTRDGIPGYEPTEACSYWPTRIERSGTKPRSGRGPGWSGAPYGIGRRDGSRRWRRSRPYTARRRPGTTPIGTRSSASTTCSCTSGHRPSWPSIERSRWGSSRARKRASPALEPLIAEPQLAGYGYLAAARAEFLRRLGRDADARPAYEEALLMTENHAEQQFLARRLAEVTDQRHRLSP